MVLNTLHREYPLFFHVLSLVSDEDLCLGPYTVSLPFFQSNCIGEMIKIKIQKQLIKNADKTNKKYSIDSVLLYFELG